MIKQKYGKKVKWGPTAKFKHQFNGNFVESQTENVFYKKKFQVSLKDKEKIYLKIEKEMQKKYYFSQQKKPSRFK